MKFKLENFLNKETSKAEYKVLDDWIYEVLYSEALHLEDVQSLAKLFQRKDFQDIEKYRNLLTTLTSDLRQLSPELGKGFVESFRRFRFKDCNSEYALVLADSLSNFEFSSTCNGLIAPDT